jgi:hypothetical protein
LLHRKFVFSLKTNFNFLFIRLRSSRGCSPFRLYSAEPESYIYYSVRNIFLQIENKILVTILMKLTSAVFIVPLILILMSAFHFFKQN